jgi:hypothetical protein
VFAGSRPVVPVFGAHAVSCLPACLLGSLGLNSHRIVDLVGYRRHVVRAAALDLCRPGLVVDIARRGSAC